MIHSGIPELKNTCDLKYIYDALKPAASDSEATAMFTRYCVSCIQTQMMRISVQKLAYGLMLEFISLRFRNFSSTNALFISQYVRPPHLVSFLALPLLHRVDSLVSFCICFCFRLIEASLSSSFTRINFFIHNLAQLRFHGSSSENKKTLSFTSKIYTSEEDGVISSAVIVGYQKRYDPTKEYVRNPINPCPINHIIQFRVVEPFNSTINLESKTMSGINSLGSLRE